VCRFPLALEWCGRNRTPILIDRSLSCGRLRHQLAMQIPAEISELMQPAHCWPKNSGSVHISADVAPINQPSRFRPERYWPMKPTSTAPKPTTCHAAFMAGTSEFRPLCCRCEVRTSAWRRPSLPMAPHQDGSVAVPPIRRSTLIHPSGPRTMLTSGGVLWMHRICDRPVPWAGGEFLLAPALAIHHDDFSATSLGRVRLGHVPALLDARRGQAARRP
jgi:hypothetical protein